MIACEGPGIFLDGWHYVFELTLEAVTFAIGAAWAWVRVKRHIHRDLDEAERRITQHLHEDIRVGPDDWHQG